MRADRSIHDASRISLSIAMYAMWPSTEDQSVLAGPIWPPGDYNQAWVDGSYEDPAISCSNYFTLQVIRPPGFHPFFASQAVPSTCPSDEAFQSTQDIDETGPRPYWRLPPVVADGRVVARFAITPAPSADQLHASWVSARGLGAWTNEEQRTNRQGWAWASDRIGRKAVLQAWISNVDRPRVLLDDRIVWVNCIHYRQQLYITLEEAIDVLALCIPYKLVRWMREHMMGMLAMRRSIVCNPNTRNALMSHILSIPSPPIRYPAKGFMRWNMFESVLFRALEVRGRHWFSTCSLLIHAL